MLRYEQLMFQYRLLKKDYNKVCKELSKNRIPLPKGLSY